MAHLFYQGTHGTEDPTRASMPFIMANGAIEAGHEATIFLAEDAVVLMRDVVAESITAVGWGPLKEHLSRAVERQIPVYV